MLRRGDLTCIKSGGGGIRTRGAKNAHTLSRRAQSTALSPLRFKYKTLWIGIRLQVKLLK